MLNLVIEYDVNGDGTIDFDEFLEMMRKQAEQQDNSAELREAFEIFDRDGNGYIDAAELKKVTAAQLLAWILTPSPHSHDPFIPNNIMGCDVVNIMLLDTVTDRSLLSNKKLT